MDVRYLPLFEAYLVSDCPWVPMGNSLPIVSLPMGTCGHVGAGQWFKHDGNQVSAMWDALRKALGGTVHFIGQF